MKIKVSVPATSANIGSGFDALGLAVTLVDAILKRGCARMMAFTFIKAVEETLLSAKCWQVKFADALTAIRFCMGRGCLRTSQFPSAKL